MDHQRSCTVQDYLSNMLDELNQWVWVLRHSMVWPGSEEKVLQFEGLRRWVIILMGKVSEIRKYTVWWFVLWTLCIYRHSHFWLSCPWFHSQHSLSFQSLSQWSPCLTSQMAYSIPLTSTVHTWAICTYNTINILKIRELLCISNLTFWKLGGNTGFFAISLQKLKPSCEITAHSTAILGRFCIENSRHRRFLCHSIVRYLRI